MKRFILNAIAALSLLLLLTTMGLWVRGAWVADDVRLRAAETIFDAGLYARSGRGVIEVYQPIPSALSSRWKPPFTWKITKVAGTPKERWLSRWWPAYERIPVAWSLAVPYWMLSLTFLAVLILALWRRKTPVKEGLCRTCGYDLCAHKPGDRCPECGTAIPAAPSASPAA